MFTPQQIEEVSFDKAVFGGYDMNSVDDFLAPLTEDYVTLYKENALLKSKMRILLERLEEYRSNEGAVRQALVDAQATCDKMIRQTEAKCAQMLQEVGTNASPAATARDLSTLLAAEALRVEDARKAACERITDIQDQMQVCIQALERIKAANRPKADPDAEVKPKEIKQPQAEGPDLLAEVISGTLEATIGAPEEPAPKAEPNHPQADTTSKFSNLQFGRNYSPIK